MTKVTTAYTGRIPLGAIIGFAANVHVDHTYPSGVIKNGMVRCDGQTFISLGTGKYNPIFTGSLPNLTGNRFLLGSTIIGDTGGLDTVNATHTHTITTGFGLSGSWVGTSASYTVSVPAHYHNTGGGTYSNGHSSHSHTFGAATINVASDSAGGGGVVSGSVSGGPTTIATTTASSVSTDHGSWTAFAGSGLHSNGNAAMSASGTFTPNGTVSGSFTNPTLTTGGMVGTIDFASVENKPQYVSCIFVMRVI